MNPLVEPPATGPDFAKKLFQLLQDSEHLATVSWSQGGDSFIIWDMTKFTNDVLPKYFKHSNFSSFVRQLNKYDFHKVKLSNELKSKTPNVWEFQHPDFTQYNVNGLDNIKRKVPIKREGGSTEPNPQSGNFQYVSIHQFRSLEDRVKVLERENVKANDVINQLRSTLDLQQKRYSTILTDQLATRSVDEMIVSSVQNIIKTLNVQLGIQLPNLDLSQSPLKSTSPLPNTSQNIPIAQQHQHQHQNPQQLQPVQSVTQSLPIQTPVQQQQPSSEQIKFTKEERVSNRPQGSVLHVLLVEDDEVCITLCQKFLMKYGCTVVVSRDGLSAISEVKRVKFDLVLMDIVMPTLDGASATSIIRSFDNDTPIIAMTGNYQREDLMTYLNHGMTDILAKPFSKDDLYMILEKHHIDRLFIQPESNGTGGDVNTGDELRLDLDEPNGEAEDPLIFEDEDSNGENDFKRRRFQ